MGIVDIGNDALTITLEPGRERLFAYSPVGGGLELAFAPPVFEVDGREVVAALSSMESAGDPVRFPNGVEEHRVKGRLADAPALELEVAFRLADGDPVLRFAYTLRSDAECRLTKTSGERLTYFGTSFAGLPRARELRLSDFNEMVHSYCPVEEDLARRHFEDSVRVMGPVVIGESDTHAALVAYEHGSQSPDRFLEFALAPDRSVSLRAVKGNYYSGERVDGEAGFRTIWMEAAAVEGTVDDLARAYRAFVADHMSQNLASRRPYVFYNTWANQEREKWWRKGEYLAPMNQERILAEIDVAHRMGIEVFVLDTGWYEKTGDWRVSVERFPDRLAAVRAKLDDYGMKLGLWFNPLAAAMSSSMRAGHEAELMTTHRTVGDPFPVWDTEESQCLCLVSGYADAFADELIRLVKELGVTYFKWDAIGQYGCDSNRHAHGSGDASARECSDRYAFELVRAMSHVVDRVCEAAPEAIVDFDVTEGGRCVGLAFLAAGKYFLINNGPYYNCFDLPPPVDGNPNMFFHPGPARGWICRTPLAFDRWVPSVLFLTHYLPDDPAESQEIQIASLILGQNGIWGDLLGISPEGVARFGRLLGLYRQVRDDLTRAWPVRSGLVGSSPEVHEKIAPNGRGAVVVFANARGRYTYVTANRAVEPLAATAGCTVSLDREGRAVIDAEFARPGARIVYFGAKE